MTATTAGRDAYRNRSVMSTNTYALPPCRLDNTALWNLQEQLIGIVRNKHEGDGRDAKVWSHIRVNAKHKDRRGARPESFELDADTLDCVPVRLRSNDWSVTARGGGGLDGTPKVTIVGGCDSGATLSILDDDPAWKAAVAGTVIDLLDKHEAPHGWLYHRLAKYGAGTLTATVCAGFEATARAFAAPPPGVGETALYACAAVILILSTTGLYSSLMTRWKAIVTLEPSESDGRAGKTTQS